MNNLNKNWIVASDLVGGSNKEHMWRFVVPIYQRVFTWGRREVERLLLDLYRHFVGEPNEEPKKESDYYLGVITVVGAQATGVSDDPNGELVLVDGQQRLTCLMLLGALLGWNLGDDFLRYEARPADRDAKEKILKYFKEHFKTGCSMADEEVWEKVLSADERGKWETANQAMNEFIRCAFDLRDEKGACDENGDPIRVLSKLREKASTIASHLKLFISELPKDPYVRNLNEQNKYFEKMNVGGRQLEPHEILKVRICGRHKNPTYAFAVWNQAVDFSERFELSNGKSSDRPDQDDKDVGAESESLEAIVSKAKGDVQPDAKIGKEPQDSGEDQLPTRSGLISVEMFLLHVLTLCIDRSALLSGWREDKLLDAFSEVSEIDEVWADKFVEFMKNYRSFLDNCIIHLEFDSEQNAYEYCFESQDDDEGADDKARRKSKQFQAMLFVSDRGKQGKQEWLLKAYQEKGHYCDATSGVVFDFEKQLACLKGIDAKCATADQKRLDYVDTLCYSDQSRWLFWRLDYLLWECVEDGQREFGTGHGDSFKLDDPSDVNKQDDTSDVKKIRNFRFHSGRSIEHLHPQTDEGERPWNEPASEGRPVRKDTFGNLCLLTPALNSALGNASVAVKLARIKDLKGSTGLQSVKMLFMYKECEGVDSKWTPEAAERHLARMKNVLKGSYLYPTIARETLKC